MEARQRIELLKENGDCSHCCGDHLATDCSKKDRVCGGNKDDRGCARSHRLHELHCIEAKVFSIQAVYSMTATKKVSEGVLLLIMKVKTTRKGVFTSVFWDNGCTSNFVQEQFARESGFRGRKENLSVTTLGGVVSEYVSVMVYSCSIVDIDGNVEYFEAYGMETITGAVTEIGRLKIKRLFPHLSEANINMLQRHSDVNILLGIGHPSWHPDRTEKARGGGDFWIYRGKFGSCVGGRHPEIKEETRKSDSLFVTVHKNFHISVQSLPSISHELEFCPLRSEKYQEMSLVEYASRSQASILNTEICSESNDNNVDAIEMCTATPPLMNNIECECSIQSNITDVSNTEEQLSNVITDISPSESEMCYGIRVNPLTDEDLFFKSQAIGTVVQPECGGCKCGKCPIPGMRYSFKEQQEYDVIQRNLVYDEHEKRWYTEYPWKTERSALPRNDNASL